MKDTADTHVTGSTTLPGAASGEGEEVTSRRLARRMAPTTTTSRSRLIRTAPRRYVRPPTTLTHTSSSGQGVQPGAPSTTRRQLPRHTREQWRPLHILEYRLAQNTHGRLWRESGTLTESTEHTPRKIKRTRKHHPEHPTEHQQGSERSQEHLVQDRALRLILDYYCLSALPVGALTLRREPC